QTGIEALQCEIELRDHAIRDAAIGRHSDRAGYPDLLAGAHHVAIVADRRGLILQQMTFDGWHGFPPRMTLVSITPAAAMKKPRAACRYAHAGHCGSVAAIMRANRRGERRC